MSSNLHQFLLVFTFALGLGFVNSSQAMDTTVTIQLKSSTVFVFEPLITIADVAEITTTNSAARAAIAKLDLEFFEDDQEDLRISRRQLKMRVRLAGVRGANVVFRGPTELTVKRLAKTHPTKMLKNAVTKAIALQFGIERNDIRVSFDDQNPIQKMSELARFIDSAVIVFSPDMPMGKSRVRFIYHDEDESSKTLELDCRITVLQEMLVAQRHIPRGATISAVDVRRVKRPLEDKRLVPANLSQSVGHQALTAIQAHSVIRTSDIVKNANKPVVKRNDIVDVVISRGGLKVRLKNAKVLTPGSKGDTVQVLNTRSNKKLTASVVNKTLLEIR